MGKLIVAVVALMLLASAVHAQVATPVNVNTRVNDVLRAKGSTKVLVGVGVVALGALVTARASDTLTLTSPIAPAPTIASDPNTSRSLGHLVTGVVIGGVGGVVLWSGAQDAKAPSPTTTLEISVGKRSSVFVHSSW